MIFFLSTGVLPSPAEVTTPSGCSFPDASNPARLLKALGIFSLAVVGASTNKGERAFVNDQFTNIIILRK